MTHWKKLVGNSDTLTAEDFIDEQGRFRDSDVMITAWEGGVFEAEDDEEKQRKTTKAEHCILLTLEDCDRKFSAKTLNCMLIEAMFGSDVEGWTGHRITIGYDTVEKEFRGALAGKPCIRVKGSPELSEPLRVELRMPRKKRPIVRMLRPSQAPAPQEYDDGREQARQFFNQQGAER